MEHALSRQMLHFIDQSPSRYHAVENLAALLQQQGFTELYESERWQLEPGRAYYVRRGGSSIIGFRLPERAAKTVLIAAAHSDSPTFRIKTVPQLADSRYVRLNTEPYGGGIWRSWLDRPLSVAGRVVVQSDEGLESRLVDFAQPTVLIPGVAIHLEHKEKELDAQRDLPVLYGQAGAEDFMEKLAKKAQVKPEQLLSADLYLYLCQPGFVWGASQEFLSAPRLDDLECAYCAAKALGQAGAQQDALALCGVFDNEEVGSTTRQGADSDFLAKTIQRACLALGMDEEGISAMLASGMMLSADNAHAVHPARPELADLQNAPEMNKGVVIKYAANQKYTTDALSAGLFQLVCRQAGVPFQVFYNRSGQPGGSTLGNLSNRHVSLPTVDIGLAQLAMHSPCETAGSKDAEYMLCAMQAFFETPLRRQQNRWQLG
ncbi:MAG: M18 family aminopeptidase [Pygmaiobacter massiliensis]|nr:M18 family aminopeptidase [Pygmaiobacter massiliensis]